MKPGQSVYSQAAEVTRRVEVAFPTLADADRRAIALKHFTKAWESKSIQRHLLAVASLIIKAAVQATEEYLAVSGSEHAPRVMPVEQTELLTQPSALEISLKAMAEAVTQHTMLLQRVLEKVEQRPARQQKGCFRMRMSLYAKGLSSRQQAAAGHYTNNGEKCGGLAQA